MFTALAQYIDPLVGLLAPATIPQNLYSIRGPIYVEPSSLQPPIYATQAVAVGPPVVSPPMIGQPMVGSNQYQNGIIGSPLMGSPSPYNPYASNYPLQMMYDEQQDDVSPPLSPPTRRFNTNVQSGIQQIGQGNMNLQGNIQQVNRRSLQPSSTQASRSFEHQTNPNQRTGIAQADEILLSDAALRNAGPVRALTSRQLQNDALQGLNPQQQSALQAMASRRQMQADQVQSFLRSQQQLQAPRIDVASPYTRSQLQALGLGQMQNDQLQAYGLGQAQNDQLQAFGLGQSQNDQMQNFDLGQMQNDQMQAYGLGQSQNDQLQAFGLGQSQNDQLQAYGLGQAQNNQLQAFGLGQMQNDPLQAYGFSQLQNDPLNAYSKRQLQAQADQIQALKRMNQNDQLQALKRTQQNDQLQALARAQQGIASRSQFQAFRPRPPIIVAPTTGYAGQLQFGRQDFAARRYENQLNDELADGIKLNDATMKSQALSDTLRQAKGYTADTSARFNDAVLLNDDLNDAPHKETLSDPINAKRAKMLEDALNDELADDTSNMMNDNPHQLVIPPTMSRKNPSHER